MDKRERVRTALAGGQVDRPPATMWRHFYDQESTADGLTQAMLSFQLQYDWDFMKVNPRAQYHVEDWGATFSYSADPYEAPIATYLPVKSPQDWRKLAPLDPHQGTLGEQLRALGTIKDGLHGDVPFVMTVFNPIAITGRLVESDQVLVDHLREYPQEVHAALDVITETYCAFVTECLNVGADGIFFATTSWASHDLLTDQEYQEFGRPYDLRVLDAAREASFNILHVCRSNNMLRELADYPGVHALNWDAWGTTNPTLAAARGFTDRPLIGGVRRRTLLAGPPADVARQVQDAVSEAGDRGFMVGPGCSIPPQCPEQNLLAVKEALGI